MLRSGLGLPRLPAATAERPWATYTEHRLPAVAEQAAPNPVANDHALTPRSAAMARRRSSSAYQSNLTLTPASALAFKAK